MWVQNQTKLEPEKTLEFMPREKNAIEEFHLRFHLITICNAVVDSNHNSVELRTFG
jgi:hypothetical protein